MGYRFILLEKNFGRSHRSTIERKVDRYLEMMNHLNGMKVAWHGRLGICSNIYDLCTKTSLLGIKPFC